MRKLYIIRENEEDGRLLDALIAAGHSTDDCQFENPVCPVCGSSTLLAFSENGEFDVVTWFCLSEQEGDTADSWYLICANLECTWEEQVERVRDPMGATIFDLESAHHEFDEYSGLISRDPPDMLDLIEWFKEALEAGPNRKLQCFLDEAEWRYSDHLERTRKWIDRVPAGKRIGFRIDGEEFEGTFITGTEQGFMVLTEPEGELKSVRTEEVYACFPRRPDRDELSPKRGEVLKALGETDEKAEKMCWVMINCATQYVVIQGFHLELSQVDRFGQYHVRCWEAAAAAHLGLTEKAENYWEGIFRRADVESRYDVRRMVKVKGCWVDTYGTSRYQEWPAVRTYDPVIASELGLKQDSLYNLYDEDDNPRPPQRPAWSGIVPEEEVEDRKEVRLYHWPLPEFPLPDSR